MGGEGHVYDLYPFYACNEFEDNALALKLKADIALELAKSDCDEECKRFGTGWHHIMLANGIVLILLSITYVFYTIGAYVFATRCIAACLNMWLGCAHFACIIATAFYRFNNHGQLAAICKNPSFYKGENEKLGDSWTFQKDG